MSRWAFETFFKIFRYTEPLAFVFALGNLIVNTAIDIAFGYSLRVRGR